MEEDYTTSAESRQETVDVMFESVVEIKPCVVKTEEEGNVSLMTSSSPNENQELEAGPVHSMSTEVLQEESSEENCFANLVENNVGTSLNIRLRERRDQEPGVSSSQVT